MKLFVVLVAALLCVAAEELYTSENDDLDIDALIANPKEFQSYIDCFNNKGPCSPMPSAFKVDLAEAIRETCAKCTLAQKKLFKKFLEVLISEHPTDYQTFKQIYDTDSKHLVALQSMLSKI